MKKKDNIIFLTLDFLPEQKQKKGTKLKFTIFAPKIIFLTRLKKSRIESVEKLVFFFRQNTRKIEKNAEML